jgi:alpha-glucosidase/alpha-D-xyloside xylohydrolase
VADAPIDILPLFVRAGSIVPLGSEVDSMQVRQKIAAVHVYPGANGTFTLFEDDGKTYAYEKGDGSITKFTWDDTANQLRHEGASASSEVDRATVEVIGR